MGASIGPARVVADFDAPGEPPTVTAQQKGVAVRAGRARFYTKPRVEAAGERLALMVGPHTPKTPIRRPTPICVAVEWRFTPPRGRKPGYRVTRPDVDNLMKLLLDVMTRLGWWQDDAQVARMEVSKRWSRTPGLHVTVATLDPDAGEEP